MSGRFDDLDPAHRILLVALVVLFVLYCLVEVR